MKTIGFVWEQLWWFCKDETHKFPKQRKNWRNTVQKILKSIEDEATWEPKCSQHGAKMIPNLSNIGPKWPLGGHLDKEHLSKTLVPLFGAILASILGAFWHQKSIQKRSIFTIICLMTFLMVLASILASFWWHVRYFWWPFCEEAAFVIF